jgi:hypothetical protein
MRDRAGEGPGDGIPLESRFLYSPRNRLDVCLKVEPRAVRLGVSLKGMSIDLSDEDVARILAAIEPYAAYLRSQNREDGAYSELAERLQRTQKKPAASVTTRPAATVRSR